MHRVFKYFPSLQPSSLMWHSDLMVSVFDSESSVLNSSSRRCCLICVLGLDTTPTVSLSVQVYKWVLANSCRGQPSVGLASDPEGADILLVTSCFRIQDKFQCDGPLS